MHEVGEQHERLRNAVRQPIAALTAVEVDTVARARETVDELHLLLPDRPNDTLDLNSVTMQPGALLDAARTTVTGWPPEIGVLFVIDRTEPGDNEPVNFWREMNFLREAWDTLAVHVIFLLLPLNYRLMLTVADHFADWIPLRFHLLDSTREARIDSFDVPSERSFGSEALSPVVARQRLAQLEPALAQALREHTPPTVLMRRFYLPMFEAAVSLGDFHRAAALFDHVDEDALSAADHPRWFGIATIYHLERSELPQAHKTATELLQHALKCGNADREAAACHYLGRLSQEQCDYRAAERWYRKSLAISERLGNERRIASAYHSLGAIAAEQHQLNAAEHWYGKSLEAGEKLGEPWGAADTYHQLGLIAQERRDLAAAEQWYRRSLAADEKLGHEHGVASTCHQLGRVYQERRDFTAAERWYRRSLALGTKLGNEYVAAIDYAQLGTIAQERNDFATAEMCYHESLAVSERLGLDRVAAITYAHLGILASLQGQPRQAGRWLTKSIRMFTFCGDSHGATINTRNFAALYRQADEGTRQKLATLWEEAGLGSVGEALAASDEGGTDTAR